MCSVGGSAPAIEDALTACRACNCTSLNCTILQRRQRICCPDCTHVALLAATRRKLVGAQCTLPGLLRTLDLEPLLRGALLEEMAAVLLRAGLS